MIHFEKYHPIMTPNFIFDWLTTVKLADVFQLRQQISNDLTPMDTANYVNETMRIIFHNQQLVWAISEKTSQTFVGIASIDRLEFSTGQASIQLQLLPAFQRNSVLVEIFTKLRDFTTLELELPTILMETTDPLQQVALKQVGFQVTQTNHFKYQV